MCTVSLWIGSLETADRFFSPLIQNKNNLANILINPDNQGKMRKKINIRKRSFLTQMPAL